MDICTLVFNRRQSPLLDNDFGKLQQMIQTSKQSSIEKFQDMACCHGKIDKKISQNIFFIIRTDSCHLALEPTFTAQMTQEKVE